MNHTTPHEVRDEDPEPKFDFLLAVATAVILLALVAGFVLLFDKLAPDQRAVERPALAVFMLGMVPSIAAVAIVYLVGSYLLGRRGLAPSQRLARAVRRQVAEELNASPGGVVEITEHLTSIDFRSLIYDGAKSLYIVARFFDRMVESQAGELERLLVEGGRVLVILPDPGNDAVMQICDAERGDEVRDRTERTIMLLVGVAQRCGRTDSLDVRLVPNPINYSAWVAVSKAVLWNSVEHLYDDALPFPMYFASAESGPDTVRAMQLDIERLAALDSAKRVTWVAGKGVVPAGAGR